MFVRGAPIVATNAVDFSRAQADGARDRGGGVFADVNRTIEALLKADLPADVAKQVSISFATPDETFPPTGLTLPAINLFLFEIHENAQLSKLRGLRNLEQEETEPVLERRPNGTVHVDCHYLVTAVAQQQLGSELDEHRILGAALKVLLRHRALPESVLRGELVGKTVRAIAIQQGRSGIELLQSLKGKPRACLHYTLTVPVDFRTPESAGQPDRQQAMRDSNMREQELAAESEPALAPVPLHTAT